MTDRLKGATITFATDIRVDDAEPILAAIRMITGVVSVDPILYSSTDYCDRVRIYREFADAVYDAVRKLKP